MRIVVLCATQRGYRFLETLFDLMPQSDLVVFSFPEEPWEPPFVGAIRELAHRHGASFFLTRQVNQPDLQSFWQTTDIDLILAVSWRYLIPEDIYQRARRGAFVFHDSLLPQYRGFSPSVWAIINGETQTGVTLFEMSQRVDAGAIVDQAAIPILEDDTIADLMVRVTNTYLILLQKNISGLVDGTAPRQVQDESHATYTCRRLLEDNQIHWQASSRDIYNLIRAVSPPYPGAYTYLAGQKLYILGAQRLNPEPHYVGRIPGRVVEVRPHQGSVVLSGDGALLLTQVREDQKTVTCAATVLNSLKQTLGY
jgi:methionyl-tRNA formyltransferase